MFSMDSLQWYPVFLFSFGLSWSRVWFLLTFVIVWKFGAPFQRFPITLFFALGGKWPSVCFSVPEGFGVRQVASISRMAVITSVLLRKASTTGRSPATKTSSAWGWSWFPTQTSTSTPRPGIITQNGFSIFFVVKNLRFARGQLLSVSKGFELEQQL